MITIYKYSRYTLPFKREIKINAGMDSNEILCVWVYSDSNAPKRDFKMVIVDMGEGGLKPTTPAYVNSVAIETCNWRVFIYEGDKNGTNNAY